MKISVVIPTRNRCELLDGVLNSIVDQTLSMSDYEVIINDNGSTDNTREVVESYKNRIKNIVYYYDSTPGLHIGRHNGYKLAKSNIIVYADDDIIAFPTWLESIVETFKDKTVALVGGRNLPKYCIPVPFWIQEKWYQLCKYGHCVPALSILDFGDEIIEIPPFYVFGCNFAIRKDILTQSRGFHPDGMPFELIQFRGDGETYVSKYINDQNYKTIYNPNASVYHMVTKDRLTVDYFCKRAFCQGISDSFSDIRDRKVSKSSSLKFYLKKITKYEIIKKKISYIFLKTDIDKQIRKSYEIGYNYHQMMYNNDEIVQRWVDKADYF